MLVLFCGLLMLVLFCGLLMLVSFCGLLMPVSFCGLLMPVTDVLKAAKCLYDPTHMTKHTPPHQSNVSFISPATQAGVHVCGALCEDLSMVRFHWETGYIHEGH
jgi:hypothetical protein